MSSRLMNQPILRFRREHEKLKMAVDPRVLAFVSHFYLESNYVNVARQPDGLISCFGAAQEEKYDRFQITPKSFMMRLGRDVHLLKEDAAIMKNLLKEGKIPRYIELVLCIEAFDQAR